MIGIENIDHVAVPVIDLPRSESFYLDWLGLGLKTRRKNLDGSPRQTYVLAGENIIGLHLPGVRAVASETRAPRVGIGVTEERFDAILERLGKEGHSFQVASEHELPPPIVRSAYLLDPEENWVEVSVWRDPLGQEYLSHLVVETTDLQKALAFYTRGLGMRDLGKGAKEHFLQVQTGQLYGLRPVPDLSERSRRHGRGCHIAFGVPHSDFDEMVRLIPEVGGTNQGDPRAQDGLRPEGEKSTYLFDPDKNRLQITAGVGESEDMLPDEEKWRRITENRARQGRGISRWDRGGIKTNRD